MSDVERVWNAFLSLDRQRMEITDDTLCSHLHDMTWERILWGIEHLMSDGNVAAYVDGHVLRYAIIDRYREEKTG